ncbi:hypothetical protein DFH11DRAFT_1584584 [Phellopilus nigrolimitatus]|nr:hypothetical protein DFH11DRAFT_1584584 [Phellopilus nigrolimitatus]
MASPGFSSSQSDSRRSYSYPEPGSAQPFRQSGQPSRRASAPYGQNGAPPSPWYPSSATRQPPPSFPVPHPTAAPIHRHPWSAPASSHLPVLTEEEAGMVYDRQQLQPRDTMVFPCPSVYQNAETLAPYFFPPNQPSLSPSDSPLSHGPSFCTEPAPFHEPEASGFRQTAPHMQNSNELSLDLAKCMMLVTAIKDMKIVSTIFYGWYEQLQVEHSSNEKHRKKSLEQMVLLAVEQLKLNASSALRASEKILQSYRTFIQTIDRNFGDIERSHNGGLLRFTDVLEQLGTDIRKRSMEITDLVKSMREDLVKLVKLIEGTRDEAHKKAVWNKFLRRMEHTLKTLNGVFGLSAAATQLVPPWGTVASAALGGAAVLTVATAELSKKIRKDYYDETAFDKALQYLRDDIPQALISAELSLTSFQACHKVLKLDVSVRQGLWVTGSDASNARKTWQEAGQLLKLEDVPPLMMKAKQATRTTTW